MSVDGSKQGSPSPEAASTFAHPQSRVTRDASTVGNIYDERMSIQAAIDALQDSDTAIDDALRRVLTVGARIHSESIKQWVKSELHGYEDKDTAPKYRRVPQYNLKVQITFGLINGSEATQTLSMHDLPEHLQAYDNGFSFHQAVRSLEILTRNPNRSSSSLPMQWVALYNALGDKAPVRVTMGQAVKAAIVVENTLIGDIVSSIRTTALELLLEVESVDQHAGDAGGPTIESNPELRRQVEMHIQELHGSIIFATGDGNAIMTHHAEGDLTLIKERAKEFVAPEEAAKLVEALEADGETVGKNTKAFLSKLKDGSVNLAGGIATSAAYDGIVALLGAF